MDLHTTHDTPPISTPDAPAGAVGPRAYRSATGALPTVDAPGAIDVPTAFAPVSLGEGIHVLPSYLPVPGMGVLAANAFLLDGPETLLVDTGPGGAEPGFREALASIVDPASLDWIWLTHTDPDHMGSLAWLLDAAPHARLVTTFLAVGKLGLQMDVPMDRLYWLNPGTTVELGGRTVTAVRPPSFDAPETTGFFDHRTGTLFPADSFGALLRAPVADAGDIDTEDLADGMTLWSTIDAPWVTHTDRADFDRELAAIRCLDARRVLSSHLPPAVGLTDALVDHLARVPGATPWIGPDQAALEALLANVSS